MQRQPGRPDSHSGPPTTERPAQAAIYSPSFPAWVVLGGGALAFIGSLLPWTVVVGLFTPTFTSNGGVLAILLALAMAGLGGWMLATTTSRRGKAIAAAGCAAVLLVLGIASIVLSSAMSSRGVLVSVGGGAYMSLIGTLICGGGAILEIRRG
jgi:hypothetical protein